MADEHAFIAALSGARANVTRLSRFAQSLIGSAADLDREVPEAANNAADVRSDAEAIAGMADDLDANLDELEALHGGIVSTLEEERDVVRHD